MKLPHLLLSLTVAAACLAPAAQADPATPYLDPLIAELEARSAALEGSEDKAEQKQKKTVDKLLKLFAKDSKGPDKDMKAAGKAAKSLAKVFPQEFPSPESAQPAGVAEDTLADLILDALLLFGGDIDTLLDEAQGVVDAAPPGKCQDKAQDALDDVEALVDELGDPDPSDLPGYAKALVKVFKKALKGESLAEKATGCVPKLSSKINTATVNGVSYLDDTSKNNDDEITGVDPGSGLVFIEISSDDGLNLIFNVPSSAGTHDNKAANYIPPGGTMSVPLLGSVEISEYPSSIPGRSQGTFDFGGAATAVGSFSIQIVDAF